MKQFFIHDLPSAALGMSRRLTIFVPPSTARSPGRAPVLYLNDGQNLFEPERAFLGNTWRVAETVTALIEADVIPRIIVVGIDHGVMLRGREFLPVVDVRNPHTRRPRGRRYVDFVTREVMPFVQREFAVARGPLKTGMGGSSYGAVAALFAAIERPGTFGRLLIESPSLYVGGGYMLRRARGAETWPARVYLGVGTAETGRPDWNEETVVNVMRLEQILKKAGLGPRRLKMVIEQGATHSEGAWAARLPFALSFLFGR